MPSISTKCLFNTRICSEKNVQVCSCRLKNFDVWKDRVKDDLDQDPDIDQYLKSLPEDAMNVFGKCGNKYVVFDNKCKGGEMERQLGNLMAKLKNLITFNKEEV